MITTLGPEGVDSQVSSNEGLLEMADKAPVGDGGAFSLALRVRGGAGALDSFEQARHETKRRAAIDSVLTVHASSVVPPVARPTYRR